MNRALVVTAVRTSWTAVFSVQQSPVFVDMLIALHLVPFD